MTISIIVPVYNAAKYIDRCITNILLQTYRDFELICVNDGSTDNSFEILQQFAQNDLRIRLINKKNSGVSCARNTGLDIARGKYIAFIDSDDYVAKDYLDKLYEATINGNDPDLICSGIHDIYGSKVVNSIRLNDNLFNLNSTNSIISFLNIRLNTSPVSKLYKRDVIERNRLRFRPDISLGEDRDFNLRFFSFCDRIISTNYIGYFYRRDIEESLSHKKGIGQFAVDYESIILAKHLFIKKGFYNKDGEIFIANKLFSLILDEISDLSSRDYSFKRDANLDFLSCIPESEWQIIRNNIHEISGNKLFKSLVIYKRFRLLSFILQIIHKINNSKS